jgi:hypothetical protein
MSSSIIVSVVQEAMLADPSNAQYLMQDYFKSNGISTDKLDIFQRCWSKTLLAHESFRQRDRAERDYPLNAHQFAVDFIEEMIKHDKDMQSATNMITNLQSELQSMSKSPAQGEHSVSISSQRLEYHQQVKETLEKSVEAMKRDDYSLYDEYHDQIRQWKFQHALHLRSHLQRYRISLKQSSNSVAYNPLHKRYYKQNDQKAAELKLKAANSEQISEGALSFSSAIGISIAYSPEHDKRMWTTYQALSEVLIYPPLNLLPIPIQNQVDSITSTRVFMFDRPASHNLAEILSPVLAICLKKNPSLLLTWINQLQATRLALMTSPYRLVGQLSYQDTYIRSDGRLLLGNIAITDSKVEDDRTNACEVFDSWAFDTLTHALCISRREKLSFYRLRDIDEKKHRHVPSMVVMEGHELALELPDHLSSRKIVLPNSSSPSSTTLPRSHITVTVIGVDAASSKKQTYVSSSRASVETIALSADTASSVILLSALKAGTLSVTISSIIDGEEDEVCVLQVSVIPYYAIRSAEVAEMLAALKLAYYHRNKSMIFTSTAQMSIRRLMHYIQDNRYASQVEVVQEQWLSICQAINIHV